MSLLTDEFLSILKVNAKSNSSLNPNFNTESTTMTDSASSNYEVYEDEHVNRNSMSSDAITDLRSIAERMNSSEVLHECLKLYVSERKSVIHACFRYLNVETLSIESAKRLKWGVLDSKIGDWIKAAKICFKYYFETEKRMCEQIFHDLGDNDTVELCFVDIVRDYANQLMDIVEAFSCIRVASERIFKILDVYDTLCGLIPVIDKLSDTRGLEFLKYKAVNQIVPNIGEKAKEILLKFENSVVDEKSAVVDGEPVHQLSRYVMSRVYKLCDHKRTLMNLSLFDLPLMDAAGTRTDSLGFEEQSRFSVHVIWIVLSLVSHLEVKAGKCEAPSAGFFFAMKNIRYIVQKIEENRGLKEMVGDENIDKLVEKFEQAKDDYLKLTLEVLLKYLRDDRSIWSWILSFRVSKLTDRLKRFNVEFERLQLELPELVVKDFGFVLELRKSVVDMVVIAYISFHDHIKNVHHLETHVKYSAKEIESAIQEFFKSDSNS